MGESIHQIIQSYIEALAPFAWPLTVLGIVLVLRAAIVAALGDLSEVSYPGGRAKLARERATAATTTAAVIEAVITPTADPGAEPSGEPEREGETGHVSAPTSTSWRDDQVRLFNQVLYKTNGMSRIQDAYTEVVDWYVGAFNHHRMMLPPPPEGERTTLADLARYAVARGILPFSTVEPVEGLELMRNLAIDSRSRLVPPEQADEFVALAQGVLYVLKRELKPAD